MARPVSLRLEFKKITAENDERALLEACPDHFAFAVDDRGSQDVVETTGGSPLPSRFVIDYNELSSLTSSRDDSFPWEVAGVAATTSGTRHSAEYAPNRFSSLAS